MAQTVPQPFHHRNKKYDINIINFLQRVDSLATVSAVHPVYFHRHEDDKFQTFDDLIDEINVPPPPDAQVDPITTLSKSATIRNIADYRKEIVSHHTVKQSELASHILFLKIYGFTKLATQVFRVPLTLFIGILTWWFSSFDELTTTTITNQIIFTTLFLWFVYLVYTLLFVDQLLAMACYNWQTPVKNGTYVTQHLEPFVNTKLDNVCKVDNIKPCFPTGDIETLIPGGLKDNIITKETWIRRWMQSTIDNEWLCLDIAFPYDETKQQFYHDPTKHIVVLVHGMNGSSRASYLRANVDYHNERGYTCIALTQRIMGNSIVLGYECFNGSRVCDIWNTIAFAHLGVGNGVIDDLKRPQLNISTSSIYLNNNKLQKIINPQTQKINIIDYYEKLEEYQQILIQKRYLSIFDCFYKEKYRNPFYIPLTNGEEDDIIKYRVLNGYIPLLLIGFSMGGLTSANTLVKMGEYSGCNYSITFNAVGSFSPPLYNPLFSWVMTVVGGLQQRFSGYEHLFCDNTNIAKQIKNKMILKTRQKLQQDGQNSIWYKQNRFATNLKQICPITHNNDGDDDNSSTIISCSSSTQSNNDENNIKMNIDNSNIVINKNIKSDDNNDSTQPLVLHFLEYDMCTYLFFPKEYQDVYLDNDYIKQYKQQQQEQQQSNNNTIIAPTTLKENTTNNNYNINNDNDNSNLLLTSKYGYIDINKIYNNLDNLYRPGVTKWQYTYDKKYQSADLDFVHFDDAGARSSGYRRDGNCMTLNGVPWPEFLQGYWDSYAFAECNKLPNLRSILLVVFPQNDPVLSVTSNHLTMNIIQQKRIENEKVLIQHNNDDKDDNKIEMNGVDNCLLYIPRYGGHLGAFESWNDDFAWLSKISHHFGVSAKEYYYSPKVTKD